MKTLLYFFVLLFFPISFFAQSVTACGTDAIHKRLMKEDASYKARFEENQKKISETILAKTASGKLSATQYTVPVVVHVMHLGESVGTGTNISDAQILSAIDNLNDAFSGTGSYPTDINVDFVLAQRDGDCNASTGIIRVDGRGTSDYETEGITSMGEASGSENEETIKNLSKYPNDEFYNIWIVNEIDGNNGGSGTQGYAYFPGASSARDGAVILYNAFGYDPTGALGYNLKSYTNRNVTAIHELGHAFNLFHTFEGDDSDDDDVADMCPINNDPVTDGDACADTDPHRRDDGNCGSMGETCAGAGTSLADIVTNFMAYSSDDCQVKFSNDQRDRMRSALEGTRWSLINSAGGLAPATSPSATLSATPDTVEPTNNFNMGVLGFSMGTTVYSSGNMLDDGGYRDNSCTSFDLSSSTMYSIEVITGGTNSEDVEVYIDYNNDGDFMDAGEGIFSDIGGTIHSGNFTVPAISPNVVANTPLWVRVISDFTNNTILDSEYTPQYGQVEDFSVVISNSLSIAENDLLNEFMKISPNPNSGEFTLNYSGALSLKSLSLYNIIGKEVVTVSLQNFNSSKKIDLFGLNAGVYFATITSDGGQVTKKIIIK